MDELALLEIEDRVARLTLNRPEKRNALSLELLGALHARVDELAARDDAAVCLLTGAGKVFCAGMDLKNVISVPGAPAELLGSIAELTLKIRALPMVVVARVNGAAIGGGCGLVTVCDIAVTHPESKMGFPEVDLGVCPAVVAPWLVRAVGAGRARRILLSGGTMSGRDAHELGLVSHLVEVSELDRACEEMCGRIASAGARALVETKRLLNELDGAGIAASVRRGAEISARVVEGPEAREKLARIYGG